MHCEDDMEDKILAQGAPGGSGRFPVVLDRQTTQPELCCETLNSRNVLTNFLGGDYKIKSKHAEKKSAGKKNDT